MVKGSKASTREPDLQAEAQILYPIIHSMQKRHEARELSHCDFAAVFILAYFTLRRPKSWCNGRLKDNILPINHIETSILLKDLDEDFLRLLDVDYVSKKLHFKSAEQALSNLSIIDIFNQLQFLGVKHNADHYINKSMVMWAVGQRPVRLLHYIPTPSEVLSQQAAGERVVTLFTSIEELSKPHTSKLTYMTGMQEHSRDPLEFLLHDLKHMENFTDHDSFLEQVSFFKCMLKINEGKIKTFFTKILGYDINLWYELEYVISDM